MSKILDVNNGCETYSESIGVSNERAKELGTMVWKKMNECSSVSPLFDWIWNDLSETTSLAEKILMTMKIGLRLGLERGALESLMPFIGEKDDKDKRKRDKSR